MSLLVVGALHWDVVVRAPRLPQLDETLRGKEVAYRLGGKGGNQAIAAAQAGASVAFAGRIGSDSAGETMQRKLSEAGVDVSQLQQGSGSSGMSTAIVTETGEYGAVIVSAENHAFQLDQVEIPAGCNTLLMQNEMAPDVLPVLAAKARRSGARVIWNAAPAKSVNAGDFSYVDTLVVNRVEAADILGRDLDKTPLETVAQLSEAVPHAEIILTLGEGGVAFAAPGKPAAHLPAQTVSVHSTHGAGDVFVGTFAAGRLRGASLTEAIDIGQQIAAQHVSQIR